VNEYIVTLITGDTVRTRKLFDLEMVYLFDIELLDILPTLKEGDVVLEEFCLPYLVSSYHSPEFEVKKP